MKIKFRGKSISKEYWCYGYLIIENDGNSYIHWTDEFGNKKAEKVHKESVSLVTKYDGKEYNQFDYNIDGEMLIFCNNCMGWQFAQIDIPTKDVCINCHNCDGNFMFHDAIHNFEPIGNLHD